MESELVSGFMTEYSSIPFVMFFLSEYMNIYLMSTLFSIMLLGGYHLPTFSSISYDFTIWLEPIALGIKSSFIFFIFIWVRATLPRLRFDQLIIFGWCSILPIILALFILIPSILITFINSPTSLSCINFFTCLAS